MSAPWTEEIALLQVEIALDLIELRPLIEELRDYDQQSLGTESHA